VNVCWISFWLESRFGLNPKDTKPATRRKNLRQISEEEKAELEITQRPKCISRTLEAKEQ
jgi:hypothetical protein